MGKTAQTIQTGSISPEQSKISKTGKHYHNNQQKFSKQEDSRTGIHCTNNQPTSVNSDHARAGEQCTNNHNKVSIPRTAQNRIPIHLQPTRGQ